MDAGSTPISAAASAAIPETSKNSSVESVTTSSRRIDQQALNAFILATGDDNPIHIVDEVARALPKLRLTGKVVHGKLVQSVAIDLLRRSEQSLLANVLPVIMDESWKFESVVYPDDLLEVKYSRPKAPRRLASYQIEVFVTRNQKRIVVQTGSVRALLFTS